MYFLAVYNGNNKTAVRVNSIEIEVWSQWGTNRNGSNGSNDVDSRTHVPFGVKMEKNLN